MLAKTLKHLEALVSFDTRNPPRDIGTGGIFDYLRSQLEGFRIDVIDHGDGAVSMLDVRGNPRRRGEPCPALALPVAMACPQRSCRRMHSAPAHGRFRVR